MILIFFFKLIFSHKGLRQTKTITVLTEKNWDKLIENRNLEKIWIIIFYGDFCPACQYAAPEFIRASEISNDIIQFGSVDTSSEHSISRKYGITHLPTFKIFSKNGINDLTTGRSSEKILEGINKYFLGCFQEFNNDLLTKNEFLSIIFSDNSKIPFGLKLLSCKLKDVKFIITQDQKLKLNFNITKQPSILLINKTLNLVLKDFKEASLIIEPFFNNKYIPPKPLVQFYLPYELKSECKLPTELCILINSNTLSETIKNTANSLTDKPIKFFQGDEDWFSSEIFKNKIWIMKSNSNLFKKISNEFKLLSEINEFFENNKTSDFFPIQFEK